MTDTKLPPDIIRKLGKIIARLGSKDEHELSTAVDAMRRILENNGYDFHDLVDILEASARSMPEHWEIAPTWFELTADQRCEWISAALCSPRLKENERTFLTSIREIHLIRHLTERQINWLNSLIAKTWNGGRHG